ncbi:MAG TPA: TonB-dependent receptor [Caulobacteraceae bacterium]|jgi:vitamin B12 transporter
MTPFTALPRASGDPGFFAHSPRIPDFTTNPGPRSRGEKRGWRLRSALFASAALAAPTLAFADTDQTTPVSEVVVTATRLPSQLADVPDAIVVTRDQIDARQAVFAKDVLYTVPGLAVTDTGAFGGVTSVRIRGASSDKTLVLIDGVPQNDPADPNGAYDFSQLDLANVERIEVLEGPQSSIWGSDAIGGVISLTTREEDGWRVQGEGGTLATFDGSAAAGRRTDTWAAGLSVSGFRTQGISKADGFPERDPDATWNAGGYGRVNFGANVVVDGRIGYVDSLVHTDGYDAAFVFGDTPEFATYRAWTGDVRAVIHDPWGFTQTLTVGGYSLDRAALGNADPASDSRFTAARQDYRWTAERGAPSDRFGVIFGAERISEHGSLSTGETDSLGTTSGFVLARVRPAAPLTLTGSVRYDAPDSLRGQATGHLSAVLQLPAGFSVEGVWGQGFKTPTISEIACDFCFPAGPSVGLQPEHATNWDAALAWTSPDRRVTASLTGYRLDIRDQIELSATFPFRYVNLDRTRSTGLEGELDARLAPGLTLQGEYAYTDAVDLGAGTQMLRVPRNSGSVSLLWNRRRWQAALTVRAEGPDADENPSTFAPQTRPGFVVASLSGAYALTPRLDLTARVDNVANTRYEEVLGYGEPRRMFLIGIRARG